MCYNIIVERETSQRAVAKSPLSARQGNGEEPKSQGDHIRPFNSARTEPLYKLSRAKTTHNP